MIRGWLGRTTEPVAAAVAERGVDAERFYVEGARWDDDVYGRMRRSRAGAWAVAVAALTLAILALTALVLLLPLKTFEPYMIVVDKTTGFTEIARALDMSGKLDQKNALTVANLVRYIKARETYDPRLIVENNRLAGLLSAQNAGAELETLWASGNAKRPDKLYGKDTNVQVFVKSVSLLNERTAEVRFSTTEKTLDREVEHHWVGIVRFRYSGEPARNEWRFDNPLGFQVTNYRRDQESIQPTETGK